MRDSARGRFIKPLKDFEEQTAQRLKRVTAGAIQDLADQANDDLRAKAGNAHEETAHEETHAPDIGAVIASQVGQRNGGQWTDVADTLAAFDMGDTLRIGWDAPEAVMAEERYGFARLSAQNWGAIVRQTITKR